MIRRPMWLQLHNSVKYPPDLHLPPNNALTPPAPKMTIPMYTSLASYATPPTNYIGSTIFLSYILLALYATSSITYSLYTQYSRIYLSTPTQNANLTTSRAARARHIKIYAFLASISFATLSYHMLSFLVTHYTAHTSARVSARSLKTWMWESSLFQDFATELVRDRAGAMWTQLAILGTWFWNLWMARKGELSCTFSFFL
jgi:hypothetical protein